MDEATARILNIDNAESKRLKELEYWEFLETPYWRAVSRLVRERAGWHCEKCGGTQGLQVHHTTYRHHGKEARHLNELICLCDHCHRMWHVETRPGHPGRYKQRKQHTHAQTHIPGSRKYKSTKHKRMGCMRI